ncbi:MAG: ankyrin repeat domain-containing protein, partial [Bdellovibrionales bacterium]
MLKEILIISVCLSSAFSEAKIHLHKFIKKDVSAQDVKLAIESGADINEQISIGSISPLMIAIEENRIDIVKVLIEFGVDVNARNQEGQTALMYAIKASRSDLLELLLEQGADVKVRDE